MTWIILVVTVLAVLTTLNIVITGVLFRQLGIMVMGTSRGVNDSGIPVGRALPSTRISLVDGSEWSALDMRGKPFLVVFGATYCQECSKIMPRLTRLEADRGVKVISLVFGDAADIGAYATKMRLPALVGNATEATAHIFDVEVTPFAYAVDAHGVVRQKGLANSIEQLNEMAAAAQLDREVSRVSA